MNFTRTLSLVCFAWVASCQSQSAPDAASEAVKPVAKAKAGSSASPIEDGFFVAKGEAPPRKALDCAASWELLQDTYRPGRVLTYTREVRSLFGGEPKVYRYTETSKPGDDKTVVVAVSSDEPDMSRKVLEGGEESREVRKRFMRSCKARLKSAGYFYPLMGGYDLRWGPAKTMVMPADVFSRKEPVTRQLGECAMPWGKVACVYRKFETSATHVHEWRMTTKHPTLLRHETWTTKKPMPLGKLKLVAYTPAS